MHTIHRSHMLFVGVDVHKDTHTAVALSPFGEKIFEMKIGNEAEDFISLVEKTRIEAEKMGLIPSFDLEDVHSWGERLSSFLVERELSLEREWLVKERARLKNQLHILSPSHSQHRLPRQVQRPLFQESPALLDEKRSEKHGCYP